MIITSWTTDRLSENGNDVRVEWEYGANHLNVFVDDCQTEVLAIGLNRTVERAFLTARKYLESVERLGTTMLLDQLDAAIERAHELTLDQAYAEGGEDL